MKIVKYIPVSKSAARAAEKRSADAALYEKAIDLYFSQDIKVTAQAAWGPRPKTVAELIAQYA